MRSVSSRSPRARLERCPAAISRSVRPILVTPEFCIYLAVYGLVHWVRNANPSAVMLPRQRHTSTQRMSLALQILQPRIHCASRSLPEYYLAVLLECECKDVPGDRSDVPVLAWRTRFPPCVEARGVVQTVQNPGNMIFF